jgi:hypothetical protein
MGRINTISSHGYQIHSLGSGIPLLSELNQGMANKGENSCQIDVLVVIINCIGFFFKLEYINHVGEVISLCPASNTASGPDPIQVSHSPSVYILPKFDRVWLTLFS